MNPIRCAAILAGGLSTRMGQDKALLELEGEALVRRIARVLQPLFEQIIVVTNQEEVAHVAGLPSVADAHDHKGPLAGIEAALSHFGKPTFVVACDLPHLNGDFIRFQCENWRHELDALVAQSEDGIEPLHAIWAPSALPAIRTALDFPRPPSLRRVLAGLNMALIEVTQARRFDSELRFFDNWNTPEDVRGA